MLQNVEDAIAFRSISPADEPFLKRLYAGTRQEEMQLTGWSEAEKAKFLEMQFAAQHRFYMERFASARFEVVLRGSEPIGRLYVDRRCEEIRIIDIALLPEHRGKGLGSRLMRRLLAEAEESGLPVRIHVERFNPALRLYRRLGFQSLEDNGVYYLMEWRSGSGTT